MKLDLSSLQKAVGVVNVRSVASDTEKRVLRAGVIQNFEFTFEFSWKFMQRWIRENRSSADADFFMTRKDLFRHAAANGLIESPEPWFNYAEKRNLTSRTYDLKITEEVYNCAQTFIADAKTLLSNLEKLND